MIRRKDPLRPVGLLVDGPYGTKAVSIVIMP
jgi:hypothetical protein